MLEHILETLGPALEIVSKLGGEPESKLDHRYGAARDDVIKSLRRIYFTPSGTLRILGELSEGRSPSPSAIHEVLTEFNDAEWSVRAALRGLEFEHLSERRELSLRAVRQLDQLRYGKIDIRRELQEALNEALTFGRPVDPELAKALLSKVNALNALIESLEEEHNYRARGR